MTRQNLISRLFLQSLINKETEKGCWTSLLQQENKFAMSLIFKCIRFSIQEKRRESSSRSRRNEGNSICQSICDRKPDHTNLLKPLHCINHRLALSPQLHWSWRKNKLLSFFDSDQSMRCRTNFFRLITYCWRCKVSLLFSYTRWPSLWSQFAISCECLECLRWICGTRRNKGCLKYSWTDCCG